MQIAPKVGKLHTNLYLLVSTRQPSWIREFAKTSTGFVFLRSNYPGVPSFITIGPKLAKLAPNLYL